MSIVVKKLYYFIDKHQLNLLPEDWDFKNKWPQYIHRAERDLQGKYPNCNTPNRFKFW